MGPANWEPLSDDQWSAVSRHLDASAPGAGPARKGRPRLAERRCFEGCLWLLWTGGPWKGLPSEFGSRVTLWRRLRAWRRSGRLGHAMLAVLVVRPAAERGRWIQALRRDRCVLGLLGSTRTRWRMQEPEY